METPMRSNVTLAEMEAAHNLLAEYSYEKRPVERGYANRTLYINLSENTISEKPVTDEMKQLFTGGRGFGGFGIDAQCVWGNQLERRPRCCDARTQSGG